MTISICGYGMMVVGSLLGGILFAFYGASGKGRINVREMRESLEDLEEAAEEKEKEIEREKA